jgi:hypothetical protein
VVDARQETIRLVNRTIRDFADDPRIEDDSEWEFFCECGCFTLVHMTITAFDTVDGVCAPGHALPAAHRRGGV